MKPKLVELPNHRSNPPHCCVVSGRRDGPVVDLGELTQKARGGGPPRLYVRQAILEEVGEDLLGMVPKSKHVALENDLADAEAERDRLAAIVAGTEDLSGAEDKLREALGVSRADPDDRTSTEGT